MKYHIETYRPEVARDWDNFVKRSANGTFLHQRNYMDYHAERFNDASIIVYDDRKIKALLPAHRVDNQLFSHNGLTYGDFIFHKKLKLQHKIAIVQYVLQYLFENQITELYIKSIPFFFHKQTDQAIQYILFQSGAVIELIKPFFVIVKSNGNKPNRNREKNLKKIPKADYQIVNGIDHLPDFWQLVLENLEKRYDTEPVHSLQEIQLLMHRFPEQIKFEGVQKNDKMLAGALYFMINNTLHFQYIHTTTKTDERKAVEWLTYHIVTKHKDLDYISFGSSEVDNNMINSGLAYWKESFGSQILNQFFYKISTRNYPLLNEILQ